MVLNQVGQVVVMGAGQREWEAQGSVRISEMYLGRWRWSPALTCKYHKNELRVIIPEKRFSVNRLSELVSEVQVGFARGGEEEGRQVLGL